MCLAKCRDTDYIDFLIATPRAVTCTEAAKVQPDAPQPPAHDAFTRLLRRLEPNPEARSPEAAIEGSGTGQPVSTPIRPGHATGSSNFHIVDRHSEN